MSDEYIIVNKTAIEKQMNVLKAEFEANGEYFDTRDSGKFHTYKEILTKSTPLMPEIEKAIDIGKSIGILSYQPQGHTLDKELYKERKQDYISNLKLDI